MILKAFSFSNQALYFDLFLLFLRLKYVPNIKVAVGVYPDLIIRGQGENNNEVVLDTRSITENLPHVVLAFFYRPEDTHEAGEAAPVTMGGADGHKLGFVAKVDVDRVE